MIDGQPVRQTVISIDSEKTGMRVELPLLAHLKDTLDAGPTRGSRLHRHPASHAVDQGRTGDRIRGGG